MAAERGGGVSTRSIPMKGFNTAAGTDLITDAASRKTLTTAVSTENITKSTQLLKRAERPA